MRTTKEFLLDLCPKGKVEFNDLSSTYTFQEAIELEKDIYFLASVTEPRKRNGDADVMFKNYFVCDFDIRENFFKTHGEVISDEDLMTCLDVIKDKLITAGYGDWRYCVFSGNGFHFYFVGNGGAIGVDEYSTFVEYHYNKLDESFGDKEWFVDHACKNIGRIMRLPGTKNYKRKVKHGLEPAVCAILEFNDIITDKFDNITAVTEAARELDVIKNAEYKIRYAMRDVSDTVLDEILKIDIFELISGYNGLSPQKDMKNLASPKDGSNIGAFVVDNILYLTGTHYFSDENAGYNPFTFVKVHYKLNNADTFAWFKDKYPRLKDIKDKPKVIEISDGIIDFSKKLPFTWGSKKADARFGKFDIGVLNVLAGESGSGKCHAKGTGIIMYDGSIKNVEDIVVGDIVMGPDSKPRNVLRLARGSDMMYQIKPRRGSESFIVNSEHILSLQCVAGRETTKGNILNIKVKDLIKLPKSKTLFRYKLYKVPLEFESKELLIEPYFLGIRLGDGRTVGSDITNKDQEIIDYIEGYAERLGMKMSTYSTKDRCDGYAIVAHGGRGWEVSHKDNMQKMLRGIGVFGNKHIPSNYLYNSRDNRLQLLAGLIDSDGWAESSKGVVCFSNKNLTLVDQVLYLARSLGFRASKTNRTIKGTKYYTVTISGALSTIPTKVARKKCLDGSPKRLCYSFDIQEVGYGEYYGFELDGDHLYLIDSFVVNHNTEFSFFQARKNARLHKVCYISLEMTPDRMVKRYAMKKAGVSKTEWSEKDLTLQHKEIITDIIKDIRSTDNLKIIGLETPTLNSIKQTIKEYYDMGFSLFYIDNMGFIQCEGKEIDYTTVISRDLKNITNEIPVTINLIHHFNKGNAADRNGPRGLASLRSSGKLENDADNIIQVWRDLDPDLGQEARAEVMILLQKDREFGEPSAVTLYFNKGEYVDNSPFGQQNDPF